MRCAEAERRLSDGFDGTLAPRIKARLEAHLALCPSCRAYRDGLVRLHASAGRPAERSSEYWAGFESRLEEKLDALGARREGEARPSFPAWRRRAFAAASVLVLAAAGVWLVLARRGSEATPAWAYSVDGLAPLMQEAEADPGLAGDLDRVVRASLEELDPAADPDAAALAADDELGAIASGLEKDPGLGGPK
jgi:anti-sigma factor RsiW